MSTENENSAVIVALCLFRAWKTIVAITASFAVLSVVVALTVTQRFTASATLIPGSSSRQMGLGSIVDNMSSAANLGSLLGLLGGTSGNVQQLIAILTSRVVAEDVLHKTGLEKMFWPEVADSLDLPPWEARLKRLRNATEIRNDENGLLWIGVTLADSKKAAEVVSAYIEALQTFLNSNAISQARRNRMFVEDQLRRVEATLKVSADVFGKYQTDFQMFSAEDQVTLTLSTVADLEAMLLSKESELSRAREVWSSESSKYAQLELDIRELRDQLVKLRSKGGEVRPLQSRDGARTDSASRKSVIKSLKDLPTLSQRFLELKRDVEIQEKVFELLTEQYELAKIAEVRDDIAFTVLDEPKIPEMRSWPKRTLMVVGTTFVGFVTAVLWTLFFGFLKGELNALLILRKRLNRA